MTQHALLPCAFKSGKDLALRRCGDGRRSPHVQAYAARMAARKDLPMSRLVPHALRAHLCATYPFDSQSAVEFDARVALVLTAPGTRYTFYVTEVDADDDDLVLFGYGVSALGPAHDAWEYRRLSELERVALRNLRVERAAIPPGAYTVRELVDRTTRRGDTPPEVR